MRVTTSKRMPRWGDRLRQVFVFIGIAATAMPTTPAGAEEKVGATVIDRFGNPHDLTGIKIKDRTQLDYYVGYERRSVGFNRIDKLIVEGAAGDEERPVKLHLRSGRVEVGRLFTGGSGTSTAQDIADGSISGGARAPTGVSGRTSLGPWRLALDDVREVRFQHPEGDPIPGESPALNAAVVPTHGDLYEVTDLRVGDKQMLRYQRGRRKMTVKLAKADRIQFAEYTSGQEQRPVTITLWSGKTLHGAVDATVARYTGETDKQYARRTGAAVTGKLAVGLFRAGMHEIKLIRFHPVVEEEGEKEQAEGEQTPQPAMP